MEISQGYPHGGHNLLHRLDSRTCHSGMCWHVWTCFWRAVLPGKTSWTYSIYSWHFREACWPCHTFLTGTERPAVVTKMNLTLSADHRVFDSDIGGNTEPCYQFESNGVFFFFVVESLSSLMRLNLSKFHRSVPFGFVLKLQQHSKTYVIKPASYWCVRHSQDLRPRRAFFCDFIEFCSSCAIFTYWWLLIIGELAGATHCRLHRSLIWVIEAPWCYFEHLFFVPFVYSQDNVVCMFCYEDCNWMLRNRIFRVMLRNFVLQITWCHSFDGLFSEKHCEWLSNVAVFNHSFDWSTVASPPCLAPLHLQVWGLKKGGLHQTLDFLFASRGFCSPGISVSTCERNPAFLGLS